ncbi:MAG: hypothetical protein KGL39_02715 [Patescibacteria group bacterium]|nr:hypothetical protein [Patescibacteria group bacterium]
MNIKVTLTCKSPLNVGAKVTLRKQPDNEHDNEAIQVVLYDGTPDGYVAAFYKIRRPDTWSCGRLLDKIPDEIQATVVDLAPVVAEVYIPECS